MYLQKVIYPMNKRILAHTADKHIFQEMEHIMHVLHEKWQRPVKPIDVWPLRWSIAWTAYSRQAKRLPTYYVRTIDKEMIYVAAEQAAILPPNSEELLYTDKAFLCALLAGNFKTHRGIRYQFLAHIHANGRYLSLEEQVKYHIDTWRKKQFDPVHVFFSPAEASSYVPMLSLLSEHCGGTLHVHIREGYSQASLLCTNRGYHMYNVDDHSSVAGVWHET